MNRHVPNEDVACFLSQPAAIALFTGMYRKVASQFITNGMRFCFFVTALHVRDHTFKGMGAALSAHAFVVECDLFIAAAVEYYLLNLFWQIFKCGVEC